MLLALTRWIQGATCRTPARRGARGKLSLLRLEDRAVPALVAAVGSGPGMVATVNVYDETGALLTSFQPYGSLFQGGVSVALGDVTGDGVLDVVTGAGAS